MPRPPYRPTKQAIENIKMLEVASPLVHDEQLIQRIAERHTLTPEAVAFALGCSVRTLQRLRIPHIRVGTQVRYRKAEVINWIQRHQLVNAA
jgi:excisionase family DNA binding protein